MKKSKFQKAMVKTITKAAVIINPLSTILMAAQSKYTNICIPVIVTASSVWIWIVISVNIPGIRK